MKPDRDVLLKVMLWSLGLATLCGIVAVLTASLNAVARIAGTSALTALISSILWTTQDFDFEESDHTKTILWFGCGAVFLTALGGIWSPVKQAELWSTAALTAFVCSVACSVAWRVSLDLQGDRRDRTRLIVVAGMVLCYLFGLLGIWVTTPQLQGKFGGSAVVFLVTSLGTAAGWKLRNQPEQWLCGSTVFGLSLSSLLVWLIGIWFDAGLLRNHPGFDEQCYQLGFSLAGWGVAAAVCLTGWTREDRHPWRWIGVGAAILGWCLRNAEIFGNPKTDTVTELMFVLGSISLVVIYFLIMSTLDLSDWQLLLRNGTYASLVIATLLVDLLVITDAQGDSFLVRLTIAAVLAASSGTLILVFLGKPPLNFLGGDDEKDKQLQPEDGETTTGEFSAVFLQCPRCQHKQNVAVGKSSCEECDLKFRITISA